MPLRHGRLQTSPTNTGTAWRQRTHCLLPSLPLIGEIEKMDSKISTIDQNDTSSELPPQMGADEVLRVENLRKWYPLRRGFVETLFSKNEMYVKAVELVSFSLKRGEIFAIAGERRRRKTTLWKVMLTLVDPTRWIIVLHGTDIT